MAQRTGLLALGVLLCVPSPGAARQPSHVYYVDVRGDEGIKRALLAQLTARACIEEADLHSIETYVTSKERGGECHAFREFQRSSGQRHVGHYLLRITVKDPVRGRRRYTVANYFLTARKFEQVFETGGSFPEARFVKEAANEIAIRTFQLVGEPERPPESVPLE